MNIVQINIYIPPSYELNSISFAVFAERKHVVCLIAHIVALFVMGSIKIETAFNKIHKLQIIIFAVMCLYLSA